MMSTFLQYPGLQVQRHSVRYGNVVGMYARKHLPQREIVQLMTAGAMHSTLTLKDNIQ